MSLSLEPTHYAEGKGFEQTEAANALVVAKDKLSLEWAAHKTPAERYEAFCALTPKAKAAWVAFAVASSISTASADDTESVTTVAVGQLGIDVAAIWRPSAENYFKGLKGCDPLLDIGREWFGDVWVQKHRTDKKSVLVQLLHDAVHDAESRNALDQEVIERIDGWLPAEIRD